MLHNTPDAVKRLLCESWCSEMRVSYDSDAATLMRGPRRVLLDKTLAEYGARLAGDGQIVSESDEQLLGISLLRYGQAMLRVNDLKSWSKARVASTFFDDLKLNLAKIHHRMRAA